MVGLNQLDELKLHATVIEFYLGQTCMGTLRAGFCEVRVKLGGIFFTWPDAESFKWDVPKTGTYDILIRHYDGNVIQKAGPIFAQVGTTMYVNCN